MLPVVPCRVVVVTFCTLSTRPRIGFPFNAAKDLMCMSSSCGCVQLAHHNDLHEPNSVFSFALSATIEQYIADIDSEHAITHTDTHTNSDIYPHSFIDHLRRKWENEKEVYYHCIWIDEQCLYIRISMYGRAPRDCVRITIPAIRCCCTFRLSDTHWYCGMKRKKDIFSLHNPNAR